MRLQRFPVIVTHLLRRLDAGSAVESIVAHVLDRRTGSTSPGHAVAILIFWLTASALPALGAACEDPGGFSVWLDAFEQDAGAQGISQRTISSALSGVAFDPGILAKDHAQGVFRQSFEQFSGRMISAFRMQRGSSLLKRYAATFDRIEAQFGVPGPVLVAI